MRREVAGLKIGLAAAVCHSWCLSPKERIQSRGDLVEATSPSTTLRGIPGDLRRDGGILPGSKILTLRPKNGILAHIAALTRYPRDCPNNCQNP